MQTNANQPVIRQENKKLLEKSKPNENTGFIFSSAVKISDPNTGKVLVQLRCN